MIKKTILSAAALTMMSASAMAGGLLTNTNQNAAYTRQMSQDGIIDITGLYANPAGTAFLSNGWHLSLNSQTAKQQRNIATTLPLFAMNAAMPNETTHTFNGKAFAPVIPSFSFSYNRDKWSVNAHFGLIGGGGKCEFGQGLGSFEAKYAGDMYKQIPLGVKAEVAQKLPGQLKDGLMKEPAFLSASSAEALAGVLAPTAEINSGMTGYGMTSYMRGRSYTFGLQLGGTYKFLDNLSGYVGVRMVYATNNYYGYVKDVVAAYQYSVNVPANPEQLFPGKEIADTGSQELADKTLQLDVNQSGFSASPIIGIDYKINKHWNIAAKYEAPTILSLKNKHNAFTNAVAAAEAANPNSALAQFQDGKKVRQDIPGMLTLGVQYSPIEKVRIMAGFHEFFDKGAKQYKPQTMADGSKQKLLDHNTWEVNCGVEYDCCKWVTISASYQSTDYGISDAGMNDLSFNNTNMMVGGGLRIHAAKCCSIDLGYMYTFYKERTVGPSAANPCTNVYNRKNWTAGLGVNLAF